MKPITHITRDVIREFMINQVLPAIKAKWPREDVGRTIFIQQDNAPSHLKLDDPLFCKHAQRDRFEASFVNHQILLILTFWTWVFFEQFKLFNTKKMQKLCKT